MTQLQGLWSTTPPVRAHVLKTAPLPLAVLPDDKVLACTSMIASVFELQDYA